MCSLLSIKISTDDKICLFFSIYGYGFKEPLVVLLNTELKVTRFQRLEYLYLNGVSDNYIYMTDYKNNEMKIYDWNLKLTKRIGQIIETNKEYYFGNGISNVKSIKLNNSKIYLAYVLFNYLYIMDEFNGKMINKFKIESNDFNADINNNIVIFTKDDYVIYYNLDGIFLKKIKLINFPFVKSLFVHDKIYCFEKLKHFIKTF